MQELLKSKEVIVAVIAACAAMIAAVVAATATIIGPFVATKISRRQITATLRQQWIDKLREDISEFLSIINQYLTCCDSPLENDEDDLSLYRRLLYLEAKIQLMLNRQESDHQNLILMIGKAIVTIHDDSTPFEKKATTIGELHNEIIALSQIILKKEWLRVKKD